MAECIECGATKDLHLHPDYSAGDDGDSICRSCLIQYWEEKIDEAKSELELLQKERGHR